MTVKELKKFFEDHLVPSRLYHMKGGYHKNRICSCLSMVGVTVEPYV